MEAEPSRKRRRYSRELKARILTECEVPGVSVAKVALAHGINANIVHGWRASRNQRSFSRSSCRWPSCRLHRPAATTEASSSNCAEARWRSSCGGRRVRRRTWRSSTPAVAVIRVDAVWIGAGRAKMVASVDQSQLKERSLAQRGGRVPAPGGIV